MTQLLSWYTKQINSHKLEFDSNQEQLIKLFDEFIIYFSRQNFITRWLNKNQKVGFYIYGPVGSGKTMLINAFYHFTPTKKKLREHFYHFMAKIHQRLADLNLNSKPLQTIAKEIKKGTDILFLDEMHISDITTAMLIQGLFSSLFKEGIYIITSSNYEPDGLWPDGLMRERFFPAISLIKSKLTIIDLFSKQDYRLIHLSRNNLFLIEEQANIAKLNLIFNQLNKGRDYSSNGEIIVNSRKLQYIKLSNQGLWLDFNTLCNNYTSSIDYLDLASRFKWFILSNLYQLTPENKDVARRFTWLIDILYDNNLILACSSSVKLEELYLKGEFAFEFTRTFSRLKEMQTKEYLQKYLTIDMA